MWSANRSLIISVTLFAGCSSLAHYQNECERTFTAFVDQTTCMQRRITEDPIVASNDLARNYVARAAALAEAVRAGSMSEGKARVELAKYYAELVQIEQARVRKSSEEFNKSLKELGEAYRSYKESRTKKAQSDTSQRPAQAQSIDQGAPVVARFCVTQIGHCNMTVAMPPNSSCACIGPTGLVQGITR